MSDHRNKELLRRAKEVEIPTDRLSAGSRCTLASLISGNRLIMFNHNMKHTVQPVNGEVPLIFTAAEKKLASFSANTVKIEDHDYKVVDIIEKNKYYKVILLKRVDKDYYTILERFEYQEVSEGYGIKMNNTELDKLDVGDKIKADSVVQKSQSFDEYMNYSYGKNMNQLFIISTKVHEDGNLLMNDADKMLSTYRVETRKISIANNDIFLNLMGNDEFYKPFPLIGEEVENGILLAVRKKTNENTFASFSNDKLRIIEKSDKKRYATGTVINFNFYHNKSIKDIPDVNATKQFKQLLIEDRNFQLKLYKILGPITRQFEHSPKLAFIYNRSVAHVEPDVLLVDDRDNPINNIIMEVEIAYIQPAHPGTKLVGRHGNKGCVVKIFEPEDSWKTESGVPIHCVSSTLSIPARLNFGVSDECAGTFLGDRTKRHAFFARIEEEVRQKRALAEGLMYTLRGKKFTQSEQIDLICDFIRSFNKLEAKEFRAYWKSLDNHEKSRVLKSIKKNGIHLHFDAVDCPNLETIEGGIEFCERNDINIKPERIVFPDGSMSLKPVYVSKMYTLRLKQDPDDKFSARGAGMVNPITDTPSKSSAKKEGLEISADTAVRLGEFENSYLKVANQPEADAAFLDLYSNAPESREMFADAYLDENARYTSLADISTKTRKKNREALDGLIHVKAVKLVIEKKIHKKPIIVIDMNRRRAYYEKLRKEQDRLKQEAIDKDTKSRITFIQGE